MLASANSSLSLNMPSERVDHQKNLKDELTRDMKSFLDKQARENPRLRRLRASNAPIQTSITHPSVNNGSNMPSSNQFNISDNVKGSNVRDGWNAGRHMNPFPPSPPTQNIPRTDQNAHYYNPNIPYSNQPEFSSNRGQQWPRYEPPPNLWQPSNMHQNHFYPQYDDYRMFPDRSYERDSYGRIIEPNPPPHNPVSSMTVIKLFLKIGEIILSY